MGKSQEEHVSLALAGSSLFDTSSSFLSSQVMVRRALSVSLMRTVISAAITLTYLLQHLKSANLSALQTQIVGRLTIPPLDCAFEMMSH